MLYYIMGQAKAGNCLPSWNPAGAKNTITKRNSNINKHETNIRKHQKKKNT